ncbi:hypothetical protein G7Y89_g15782 [Cudoniella acicularis]|uniref:Peptidase S12 Pab87-related C-terminal domain-containing protein n=1 Tax=Cudoniella acicularis TaxID=354080 RepID=A0A8H4QFP4_9HELO|nr:hypothetical protein G7Y89_g15782 [Cudoniella acicularis]
MLETLEKGSVSEAPTEPLSTYTGTYSNEAQDRFMEIFVEADELRMCIQGDCRETYALAYYGPNTFSWIQTWNGNAHRGRFRDPRSEYYLLRFEVSGRQVTGLKWAHDPHLDGQLLVKDEIVSNLFVQ